MAEQSITARLSAIDSSFSSGFNKAKKAVGDFSKSTQSASQEAQTAGQGIASSFKQIAVAAGLVKLASKAFDVLKESIGSAVARVDTLNNASRTFQNMGFSTKQITAAMDGLKASIKGLPTPLDEAVKGVQMLAASTNDLGTAQKVYSALNDAIIGFGGSTQDVSNAIVQLSQAFANGKIDAQTWNSMMQSNLGPTLNAIARQMGITTAELKNSLSTGKISVKDFENSLIELDKNGGGGLKSLHQIALDATAGIKTAMENAKTAVTRGMAEIISSIDKGLSQNNLPTIAQSISAAGNLMETALNKVAASIPGVITNLSNFTHGLIPIAPAIKVTSAAMGVLIAGITSAGQIAPVLSVFDSLKAKIIALANPVTAVCVVLAALGAAFVEMYKHRATFRNAISQIGQALQSIFAPAIQAAQSALQAFSNKVSGIGNIFQTLGDKIGAALGSVNWQSLAAGAQSAFSAIVAAVQPVWSALQDMATAVGQVIQGFLQSGVVAGVWQAVVSIFQSLWSVIQSVWSVISTLISSIGQIMGATASGVGGSMSFWQLLGQVIGNIVTVIVQVIAGIVSFAAQVIGVVANIVNTIITVLTPVATFIIQLVTVVVQTVITIIQGIVAFMAPVIAAIQAMWQTLATFFTTLWTSIVTTAQAIWQLLVAIFTPIVAAIVAVWNTLSPFFTGLWAAITAIFQTALSVIQAVWNTVWPTLSTVVSTVFSVISTVISTAMGVIQGIIQVATAVIQGDWSGAWNAIKGIAETIWNGLKSLATTVFNGIQTVITTVWNGVKSVTSSVWNGIKSVVTSIWNGLKSTAQNVFNGIKSVVTNVWNGIQSVTTSVWNAIRSATNSIWNGIKNAIETPIRAAKGTVSSIVNGIKSILLSLGNINLAAAGQRVINSFLSGLRSAFSAVQSFVGNIGSWIKAHKGPKHYDQILLIPAGNYIMQGFNKGLLQSWKTVQGTIGDITNNVARTQFSLPAVNTHDFAASVANLNAQANATLAGAIQTTVNVNKQPAAINLSLGGTSYAAFVDDISREQDAQIALQKKRY